MSETFIHLQRVATAEPPEKTGANWSASPPSHRYCGMRERCGIPDAGTVWHSGRGNVWRS